MLYATPNKLALNSFLKIVKVMSKLHIIYKSEERKKKTIPNQAKQPWPVLIEICSLAY